MKFIHKLGFYLGGVGLGLIILMFFLGGKKASCDYGPNARTTKHLAGLEKAYSETSKLVMERHNLDSIIVRDLIRYGNVDFSNSNPQGEPCKSYVIENTYKTQDVKLALEKCDSILNIVRIDF